MPGICSAGVARCAALVSDATTTGERAFGMKRQRGVAPAAGHAAPSTETPGRIGRRSTIIVPIMASNWEVTVSHSRGKKKGNEIKRRSGTESWTPPRITRSADKLIQAVSQ
jgi:hypothetical protein